MDVAYDHIQEDALSTQASNEDSEKRSEQAQTNLNTEFQQAFKAVSSSPWGAKLGGFWSSARKQGEALYTDLQKEATEAQEQATKGFSSLREQVVSRTRSLSINAEPAASGSVPGEEGVPIIKAPVDELASSAASAQAEAEALNAKGEMPESLPADIVKEAGSLVASLRLTAASKLKDLQKAEDAADEALLKFGSNVRNFLRDAVIISAPTDADSKLPKGTDAAGNEVLFETQEPGTGKKVFHTTRLDAQLHAIHTTASSFTEDPQGSTWDEWRSSFDIDSQTDAIAADLDKYEELRRAMEKLVPEKVEYKTFWMRYYFLRKAIEEEEKRRKEVLKGKLFHSPTYIDLHHTLTPSGAAAETEEEIAWDDEDEDEDKSSTPNGANKEASQSTTTLSAPPANDLLKPKSPRRSDEMENKSVADSEASYDIVSGTTSQAPGSPKEEKKSEGGKEDSDDDWE